MPLYPRSTAGHDSKVRHRRFRSSATPTDKVGVDISTYICSSLGCQHVNTLQKVDFLAGRINWLTVVTVTGLGAVGH